MSTTGNRNSPKDPTRRHPTREEERIRRTISPPMFEENENVE
jgi:hypothetical protein